MEMEWEKVAKVLVNGREYRCYCTRHGIEAYDERTRLVWRGIKADADVARPAVAANLAEMARRIVAHAYGVPVAQVPFAEAAEEGG